MGSGPCGLNVSMGGETVFELNKAMDDWRRQLGRADGCLQDDVAELEEHLHEQMTGLRQAGLTEEEAFLVSTRRLGPTDLLGEEFGKVNGPSIWLNRLRWMALGALTLLAMSAASGMLSALLTTGGAGTGLHPYLAGALGPVVCFVILVALVIVVARMLVAGETRRSARLPFAGRHRGSLLVGVVLWFTLARFCTCLVQHVAVSQLPLSVWGQTQLASTVAALALSIIVPLLLAAWIVGSGAKLESRRPSHG